jgi:hypothetical protein
VRRSQVGKAGAIAIVVAIAVAATGCGQADDAGQVRVGDAKVKALSAAAAKTDDVDTATYKVVAIDSSTNANDFTLTGSVDRTSQLTETLGRASSNGNGADATGFGNTESEVVVDGDTVYLRTQGLGGLFHVSTPWVSGDLTTWRSSPISMMVVTSDPFVIFSSDRDALDGVMEFLRTLSTGVSEVGTETVDGVPSTHYRADVGMQTIEAALGRRLAETMGTSNDDNVTMSTVSGSLHVDVWIDGQGLIRRFVGAGPSGDSSSDFGDGTTSSTTSSGTMTLTFDLLTTGQPVHIAVPPPDRVTKVDLAKADAFGLLPASTSTTTG